MAKLKKQTVLICGSAGRMGQELCKSVKDHPALTLEAAVNRGEIQVFDNDHTAVLKHSQKSLNAVLAGADIVIDFSSSEGTEMLLQGLKEARDKVVLIGTTGLTPKLKQNFSSVAKKGRHRILIAGNTSLGIFSLAQLAVRAAKQLPPAGFDVEITETHHRMKTDAPSGTALFLASAIQKSMPDSKVVLSHPKRREKNAIGIHSIRGGGVFGEHEIRFISDHEEVRLSHRAFSRSLFANGAIKLATALVENIKPGVAIELIDYVLRDKI